MKLNLKRSLIFALILALVLSYAPFAFADTNEVWKIKIQLPTTRTNFVTATLNGKIYIIGGTGGTSNLVEEYDPQTNTVTKKASLNVGRSDFQAEVVNDKIYVIGGTSASGFLSSVEEYDPLADTWSYVASMHTARSGFATVQLDGKIYAIGGFSGSRYLNTVEVFDPNTNQWDDKKSPMNFQRQNPRAFIAGGRIYVLSGLFVTSSTTYVSPVEVYDPLLNIWSQTATMNTVRYNYNGFVVDNNLYAYGGYSDTGFTHKLASLEEYDAETNTWVKKLDPPNGYMYLCNFNNKIYGLNTINVGLYDSSSDTWSSLPNLDSINTYKVEMINEHIYIISNKSILELVSNTPSLSISASTQNIKVGDQFTTTVAIHNVSNIYTEDISINYDSNLFDYVGADALQGLKIYEEDKSTPGTIRFIVAHLGTENAANGDKDLINLTFKAKVPGTGKVDITKGHIADNSTLEMDVSEENCGEDTITVEGLKDVNRSGEFTLLDLGIDAGYYGIDASQTDSTRFDTDVVSDGVIDDNDLASITASLLENSNYQPNN